MTRAWSIVAAIAVAGLAALYAHRLDDVPAYLGLDEAHFANHAYSLATTGRDLNGTPLPLFISLADPLGDQAPLPWGTTWYHPLGFYVIASALTVLPFSEWTIRLPIVLIGVLNVVLIYAVARRWYEDRRVAYAAAALLAMTPAHFILSRLAFDYLLPLPLTLAWLLFLHRLMRRPGRPNAMFVGVLLGVSCFSYVSSWLMMPLCLAVSGIVLIKPLGRRDLLLPLVAGFLVPLLALVPWVALHPDMPTSIVTQYQAGEARRSVLSAIATGTDVPGALRDALAAYWSYFNPSFLFVEGGVSRMTSTGAIGVWPMGVGVLLLIGVVRLMRAAATPASVVLLIGLLTAPLPAALKGEPFAIQRAIALLPFGILLAVGAVASLREPGSAIAKVVIVLALVSVPVQFTGFLQHYFGIYRVNSASALDPTAFRETAVVVLSRVPAGGQAMVALTAPLYDVSAKWRFYCTKAGREDLLKRTRYFSGQLIDVADLPPGSLAIVETAAVNATVLPEGWLLVAAPPSVKGDAPLTILQRQ
jgi:4-amino-4-deoxy-L-arabinose transferase-like glycosyltransferase